MSNVPGVPAYFQEPQPDVVKLAAWAKLRLAKGLHEARSVNQAAESGQHPWASGQM